MDASTASCTRFVMLSDLVIHRHLHGFVLKTG